MKPFEKLDLLLKELYQHGGDDNYHSVTRAVQNARIPLRSPGNIKSFAKKLAADGLVDIKKFKNDHEARITPDGRLFCESTSYAYQGYPIITFAGAGLQKA